MSRFDEIYETEPHYFGREPSRLVARFHTLLPGYRALYLDESLGPAHRHRDRPAERHYLAHLLARKPRHRGVRYGTHRRNQV